MLKQQTVGENVANQDETLPLASHNKKKSNNQNNDRRICGMSKSVAWLISAVLFISLFVGSSIVIAMHNRSNQGSSHTSSTNPGLIRHDSDDESDTESSSESSESEEEVHYFDADHANRSLAMSYATYCNRTDLENWDCHFCDVLDNFTVTDIISYSDIQVILGYDEEYDVLVSAHSGGTALLNAIIWGPLPPIPYSGCDGCSAQAGIQDSYKDVETELQEAWAKLIQKYGADKSWVFTGYDWGGSFASLSALYLLDKLEDEYDTDDTDIDVYTFGQTRWANEKMADYFDSRVNIHWRVTNQRDYMANLPPAFLGYKHTGTLVWYSCMNADEFQVCDGDTQEECEPIRPYMPDHRTYLQMKYGCTAEERQSNGKVSMCSGYTTVANVKECTSHLQKREELTSEPKSEPESEPKSEQDQNHQ